MALPARTPAGAQTLQTVAPNLFVIAARYLGDATQWERIADLNAFPGVQPDFQLAGAVTLELPGKNPNALLAADAASVEALIGAAAA